MKNPLVYLQNFLFIILFIIHFNGYAVEKTYEEYSRCFFVYAPIFEAAKKNSNPTVFIYAQKRLAWAGGYVQAQKNNQAFAEVFNINLESNKKAGSAIEERLSAAFRSGDAKEFEMVMNIARQCDKQLGLPTKDIPRP